MRTAGMQGGCTAASVPAAWGQIKDPSDFGWDFSPMPLRVSAQVLAELPFLHTFFCSRNCDVAKVLLLQEQPSLAFQIKNGQVKLAQHI